MTTNLLQWHEMKFIIWEEMDRYSFVKKSCLCAEVCDWDYPFKRKNFLLKKNLMLTCFFFSSDKNGVIHLACLLCGLFMNECLSAGIRIWVPANFIWPVSYVDILVDIG